MARVTSLHHDPNHRPLHYATVLNGVRHVWRNFAAWARGGDPQCSLRVGRRPLRGLHVRDCSRGQPRVVRRLSIEIADEESHPAHLDRAGTAFSKGFPLGLRKIESA